MGVRGRSAWMALRVAAVAALCVGSVVAVWRAGAEVVARDRSREEALATLALVDDALGRAGAPILDLVPDWPETETREPQWWAALDRLLQREADTPLAKFPGVGGGYFLPAVDRYLGHAGATAHEGADTRRRSSRSATAGLPARERDLIDDQMTDALEIDSPIDRVVEMMPGAVAVRASPLRVNGRRVAAVWVVVRLDDTGSLGRSVRSYQWASGMALGGLAIALLLSASLGRSIRAHAIERERLQREMRRRERLAALGTMLAGVSHEMRNPLAGIRSAAQLWGRGLMTDAELESELIGEVDRLDVIVGQLLRFSRAETQTLVPGDLNDVLGEAARLCKAAAEGQGVTMDLTLDPALPRAAIDPPALLQVFRNLTTNAIESMPKGGHLRLASRRDPSSGDLEATVSDTGPGLPPEARDHLFEPFFTTKPQGTGLGLAIAREIVLAHRGEIRARDRKAGGAEFVITLPPLESPAR